MLKLYYKIVLANKGTILTYCSIFLAIFTIFSMFSGETNQANAIYEQEKADIAIINNDKSELSTQFIKQLHKDNTVVDELKDYDDAQDALFFGQVSCIIEIPKNFQTDFEAGKENLLNIKQRPQDASGVLVSQKANSYLNSLSVYQKANPSLSYKENTKLVSKDLKQKADIKYNQTKEERSEGAIRNQFYNFLSYVLFSVIVSTIGTAMHSIYRSEMLKRNLVSPINSTKMNIKLILANVSFGLILWTVFTIVIFQIPGTAMFSQPGFLFLMNSFIFVLVSISFAFLITAIISNKRDAMQKLNILTNISGLCGAFLSGAFLPQAFIPENILQVAKFLPNYWYIHLNDTLASLSTISEQTMMTALQHMGIQFLYVVLFVVLALVIMKSKRSQDEIVDTDFE